MLADTLPVGPTLNNMTPPNTSKSLSGGSRGPPPAGRQDLVRPEKNPGAPRLSVCVDG